jgi:hypothetical protein
VTAFVMANVMVSHIFLTKNAKKVVSDRFVTAFENKSGQPANPVFMRVSAIL